MLKPTSIVMCGSMTNVVLLSCVGWYVHEQTVSPWFFHPRATIQLRSSNGDAFRLKLLCVSVSKSKTLYISTCVLAARAHDQGNPCKCRAQLHRWLRSRRTLHTGYCRPLP